MLKNNRNTSQYKLRERTKELSCLYGLSEIIEKPNIMLENIFQYLVSIIPLAWQYPEVTCSKITFEDNEYKSKNFKDTKWKQASDILVNNKNKGNIVVYYLKQQLEDYEGPFLREERALIDALTKRLGKVIEHKNSEEALQEKMRALEAFNKMAIDRELKMIELKKEIKQLKEKIEEFEGKNSN